MTTASSVSVSGNIAGYPAIHDSVFLMDGNYGNGRSWIDSGAAPWLTIDLGSPQTFNSVMFGRDRLGYFDDRDPGQFQISVSNDNLVFTNVLDSFSLGFSGLINSSETLLASFDDTSAQYIKLQLSQSGAAIDEIEIMNIVSHVPEPATTTLFFVGELAYVALCRRKNIVHA